MKTLVTGGTGFIGSHLVKALLEQGREVIVASDFSRLGMENLADLGLRVSDIEVREADLSDYAQALRAVEGAGVIFHLAARVGSLEYLHGSAQAELAALQTNLVIDANVFKACLEKGVQKIIYASSCAVYPMHKQSSSDAIFSESDLILAFNPQPLNPDGGYGWAKLLGEIQLSWMGGNIGIARIFNVYGENEPLGEKAHVIGDLIQKTILSPERDLIVRGDGNQTRDFLYVSDCVDALLKLEQKLSNTNSKDSRNSLTLNIGSGKAVSIRTIAEKVVEVSGKNIGIKYDLSKPVGPISRTADITKARTLLNWQPRVTLDEGLNQTYAWAEKRLKKSLSP
ncbi:MAG: NAD-dependent epimerase/dehydratase family protein, partial [Dehalococcoidales bacterium]|nr:NAD-dependent epimerase/dehydratase family protein [Dehalococcoidales bacterium]